MKISHPFLLLLALTFLHPISAKNIYVSAIQGSSSNNGLSEQSPKKFIQEGADLSNPGDTVFIMDGIYDRNKASYKDIYILKLTQNHSGEEDRYITYKAFPGHHPVIAPTGRIWTTVMINASYIIFDGIEIKGDNQNLTYEDALESYRLATTSGLWDDYKIAPYNTTGLSIGGLGKESEAPTHVIIRNCIVHDLPGGGIGASQADYVTFENNLVYNNSWYTHSATSGISIIHPYDSSFDGDEGYRNIISGNICHSNWTLIPWNRTKDFSDGNGIILDINHYGMSDNGAPTKDQGEYPGRTLVVNNLSVNNGGSGIHTFGAYHVDIINNTAYHNGHKYYAAWAGASNYAEIYSNGCKDVNIMNNIMCGWANGGSCNMKPGNATEKYAHNVYFRGKIFYQDPTDRVGDPKFVNESLDMLEGDFHLQQGSVAIGLGDRTLPGAPTVDFDGNPRDGIRLDAGAFQFLSLSNIQDINNATATLTLTSNPVREILAFSVPENAGDKLICKIYNNAGRCVGSYPVNNMGDNAEFNVSFLIPGAYYLTLFEQSSFIGKGRFIKL